MAAHIPEVADTLTGSSEAPAPEAGTRAVKPVWSSGDPVAVHCEGRLLYQGVLEVFAGELGVAWIREAGDGWRRMVSLAEVQLHRL